MKKSKALTIAALIVIGAVIVSCQEETGACESKFENWQGYTLYTCDENIDADMCEGRDEHFWQDKSCPNLGYAYYNDGNESWQIDEGNNGIPGPYGYWGDNSAGGSPTGGGGTGSCDESGYKGPEFDIQVDSQCKAAYYYKCVGNSDGVKAACAVYKQWQEDNSSIPNCPYC